MQLLTRYYIHTISTYIFKEPEFAIQIIIKFTRFFEVEQKCNLLSTLYIVT